MRISIKILRMLRFGRSGLLALLSAGVLAQPAQAQAPAAHSAAQSVLLLPSQIISGERATLAVLDASGRLAPGVTVTFSNGDRVTTDKTGRALFVAPLNLTEIFASIAGHNGRAKTTIRPALEASSTAIEFSTAPKFVSLGDRFALRGKGSCGDADANQVSIGGRHALLLASSPLELTIAPPPELAPGRAKIEVRCAKNQSAPFFITFLALELEANGAPLKPGEHRTLTVRIKGTSGRVALEARNLAPGIAQMTGTNPLFVRSSGGSENIARVELTGKTRGNFQVAIRLLPTILRLH